MILEQLNGIEKECRKGAYSSITVAATLTLTRGKGVGSPGRFVGSYQLFAPDYRCSNALLILTKILLFLSVRTRFFLINIHRTESADTPMRTEPTSLLPFVEQHPELIWTWDPEGFCDYFNKTWITYTGASPETLAGTQWLSFLRLEDQKGFTMQWLRLLGIGAPFRMDMRIRSAGGDYRPFRAQTIPMREIPGKIAKWFGSGHAAEAVSTPPFHSRALDNSSRMRGSHCEMADFSTDEHGMLHAWSPGAETLLSYHEH